MVEKNNSKSDWLAEPAQSGSYLRGRYATNTGVNCWKTEGFSPGFYENLRRLLLYFYRRHQVAEHREFFLDMARSKVEDALTYYDPTKSSLKTFICTVIFNEITRINSKNSKAPSYGDNLDAVISAGTTTRVYIPDHLSHDHHHREDPLDRFEYRAQFLGVPMDRVDLTVRLNEGHLTPTTWAYLWLLKKGTLRRRAA